MGHRQVRVLFGVSPEPDPCSLYFSCTHSTLTRRIPPSPRALLILWCYFQPARSPKLLGVCDLLN